MALLALVLVVVVGRWLLGLLFRLRWLLLVAVVVVANHYGVSLW